MATISQVAFIVYKRRTLGLLKYACFVLVAFTACGAAAIPALCQKKDACPWLNSGTAAGFLQGPVVSTVEHTNKAKDIDDATCEFVYRHESVVTTLRIEVTTLNPAPAGFSAYTAQCGSNGVPLKAIGNEALACSFDAKGKKRLISEQVVSRVRNRAFIVRISTNAASPDRTALRQQTEEISEQVAGILF